MELPRGENRRYLDIGNDKQLIFVETPMLHWPDSMMTYLTGDAVLFSNDAFGQHYCDEHLFNDEVDQIELYEQCQRYYANILTPFSRPGDAEKLPKSSASTCRWI